MPRFMSLLASEYGRVVPRGYSGKDLGADLSSGLAVAVIAVPLGLVVAIAAGAPPQTGLVGIIVGGAVISLLSPSRFQIGGPTESCILISVVVIEGFGLGGLFTATLSAGLLLLIVAAMRIGFLVESMPQSVVTGFVSGMGLVIAAGQIVPFLGLGASAHEHGPGEASHSHNFVFIMEGLWDRFDGFHATTFAVGLATLATIFLARRFLPKATAYPLALLVGAVLVRALDLQVPTVGTVFGAIPNSLPFPELPSWEHASDLSLFAVAIAFLASSESIFSSLMACRQRGTPVNVDREFLALGAGNVATAIWGGLPVGGCVARTAVCLGSGARSSLAGIFHAVIVAVFVLTLAGALSYVPLTSLAAVLLLVSFQMIEVGRIRRFWLASWGERFVLLLTLGATLFWDIRWVLPLGIGVSALLLVRRIRDFVQVTRGDRAMLDYQPLVPIGPLPSEPPPNVEVVSFRGALFYGTVNAVSDLVSLKDRRLAGCVFGMRHVYYIDPTACIALADLTRNLLASDTHCYFWGVQPEVAEEMARMGILQKEGIRFYPDPESALADARGRSMELSGE